MSPPRDMTAAAIGVLVAPFVLSMPFVALALWHWGTW